MVFIGKEGIHCHWYFLFYSTKCVTTLLIYISNHVFLVCYKYKCHIINFLLTSLASDLSLFVQTSPYGLGLYKEDLGPIFLCTDLAFD
jgi:hypothetical protein